MLPSSGAGWQGQVSQLMLVGVMWCWCRGQVLSPWWGGDPRWGQRSGVWQQGQVAGLGTARWHSTRAGAHISEEEGGAEPVRGTHL